MPLACLLWLARPHRSCKHGTQYLIQMTVATSDGDRLWAFRYSSEHDSRLIVSEPLRDLPSAWNEVPESSYGVVQEGQDELHTFTPKAPSRPRRVLAGT